MNNSPIIVALDDVDIDKLLKLSENLSDYVFSFKLGLEFFAKYGAEGVLAFTKKNYPIFLDLKLHDIPNTVHRSVYELCKLNINMLTIHLSGGLDMLLAAKKARDEVDPKVKLLGVSVLTSLNNDDLERIGCKYTSLDQVKNLYKLAEIAGLDAVVCSAQEVKSFKKDQQTIEFVTPGIRLDKEILENDISDQKRVMSPKQALKEGSNYLVIGRSITNSVSPIDTCREIYNSFI